MTRFLFSGRRRHAGELRRQIVRLFNEQRDLLENPGELLAALQQLEPKMIERASDDEVDASVAHALAAAEKSFRPCPHPTLRDNLKELFVAAVLVLSISTFFVQLTKIPTGSMQPTLFGITAIDLRDRPEIEIPGFFRRVIQYLWNGVMFYQVRARTGGNFDELRIHPPKRSFFFVKKQRLTVGGESYDIWFPPDDLEKYLREDRGRDFKAGDDLIKLKVMSGDHLLVDRFTYNFRRPKRGEIIVFRTRGIEKLDGGQDQLYIKRLVALGGERVRINDDHRLVINGQVLDAATPAFENIYSFTSPPRPNQYFGHVNQSVAMRWNHFAPLAPLFADADQEFQVRPKHYLAMGDNTLNSRDSREWGDLPQENVIGKCWFVYWPISPRFGWGYW